jgi:hypothetical protein
MRHLIKGCNNHLPILLAYFLLTFLFTYPLPVQMGTSLYGHELVGFNVDPFAEMDRFQSVKQNFQATGKLWFSPFIHPLVAFPGALLTAAFDEVVAFNLLLLISFPLAGFFAYLLAYQLTQKRLPSFFAGLLYSFSPYHWVHAYYHLSLSQIQWFPLYLLGLFLFSQKKSFPRGLLVMGSLLFLLFTNYYYALFGLLLTIFFILYHGGFLLLKRGQKVFPFASFWILLALLTLAGLVFFLFFSNNLLLIYHNLHAFSARYPDLFRYGSRPWGFIFPPQDNPFLGWIGRNYIHSRLEGGTLVEHTLYLGMVPLLLSILAASGGLRGKPKPFVQSPSYYLGFFGILFVLALLFSRPPQTTVGGLSIPLPAYFLYPVFPMFRSYARFGLLAYLALALLAAGGLTLLHNRWPKKYWIPALAFLLLIIEYANLPPWRNRPILPTQAHTYLSEKVKGLSIVDYFPQHFSAIPTIQRRMNNRLLTGREMAAADLVDLSRPDLFQRLRLQGVSYAIFPPDRLRHLRDKRLQPVNRFPDSVLFRIDPLP